MTLRSACRNLAARRARRMHHRIMPPHARSARAKRPRAATLLPHPNSPLRAPGPRAQVHINVKNHAREKANITPPDIRTQEKNQVDTGAYKKKFGLSPGVAKRTQTGQIGDHAQDRGSHQHDGEATASRALPSWLQQPDNNFTNAPRQLNRIRCLCGHAVRSHRPGGSLPGTGRGQPSPAQGSGLGLRGTGRRAYPAGCARRARRRGSGCTPRPPGRRGRGRRC